MYNNAFSNAVIYGKILDSLQEWKYWEALKNHTFIT